VDHEEALQQIGYMRDVVDGIRMHIAEYHWIFLLWGTVWLAGFLGSWRLSSAEAGTTWICLVALATVIQGTVHFLRRRDQGMASTQLSRSLFRMNAVLVLAAIVAPVVVANGHVLRLNLGTYIALWVGVSYVLNGLFVGRELIAIGAWIVAVSLVASFMSPAMSNVLMAVAGGGGLIATAVVLRLVGRRHAVAAA
jgi:hypothetical protein